MSFARERGVDLDELGSAELDRVAGGTDASTVQRAMDDLLANHDGTDMLVQFMKLNTGQTGDDTTYQKTDLERQRTLGA